MLSLKEKICSKYPWKGPKTWVTRFVTNLIQQADFRQLEYSLSIFMTCEIVYLGPMPATYIDKVEELHSSRIVLQQGKQKQWVDSLLHLFKVLTLLS